MDIGHRATALAPSLSRDRFLVDSHLGMVRSLASRLIRRGSARTTELDDLISVGTQALIESAGRFDALSGTKFSTFAFSRVRGAMIDAIAQLAPIPRGTYRAARRRHAAGGCGLFVTSIDGMLERGEELVSEHIDPAMALDRHALGGRVTAALDRLPARKRRFIEAHYFDGRDLQAIGREMGVSKSWASRLHAQALADLRTALADA